MDGEKMRYARKIFGRVDDDGRLTLNDKSELARICASLRGREVQLTIEQKRRQRTADQNEYYWGVVVALLSDWAGYLPEEMHEALKVKFLSEWDAKRALFRPRSTTELSTADFEEYLAKIRQWASENGLFIPLPNEEIY